MEELLVKIAKDLVKYFKQTYCRAYKTHYTLEDSEVNIIKSIYTFLALSHDNGLDLEVVYDNLKKAIYWYINIHEGRDKNGQLYSKKIRFLFDGKSYWLLNLSLENVVNMPLEQLMQTVSLPVADAKRAKRQGDLGVYEDKEAMFQDCLIMIAKIDKLCSGFKKAIKNMDIFELLYKTQLPSADYIKTAYLNLGQIYEEIKNIQ